MILEESCVQGKLGEPAANRVWEAAIILQGQYIRDRAEIVIRIFLERNPDVLIIVSTYLPEAAPELLSQYEKDVLAGKTEHAGRLVYIFVKPPTKEEDPLFWEANFANQSLQRLSSFVGLRYARNLGIDFAMKCRTDTFLGMPQVCKYLREEYDRHPLTDPHSSKIKGRIVTGDLAKSQLESPWIRLGSFHIADFWFFGRTEDLLFYFDIREGSSWRKYPEIEDLAPETNFARQWMDETGIQVSAPDGIFELMAKYFIVVDSVKTEFNFLKVWHRDHEAYLREGKAFLSRIQQIERAYWSLITRERWIKLLEDYQGSA